MKKKPTRATELEMTEDLLTGKPKGFRKILNSLTGKKN